MKIELSLVKAALLNAQLDFNRKHPQWSHAEMTAWAHAFIKARPEVFIMEADPERGSYDLQHAVHALLLWLMGRPSKLDEIFKTTLAHVHTQHRTEPA